MQKQKIENISLNEFCDQRKAQYLLENIDDISRKLNINTKSKIELCKKYCKEVVESKSGISKRLYKNENNVLSLKKDRLSLNSVEKSYVDVLASTDYTAMNIDYFEIESEIRCTIRVLLIKYLKKNDFDIALIGVNDSILVRNTMTLSPAIINDIQQHILKKTGHKIKCSTKKIESEIKIKQGDLKTDEIYFIDDEKDASDILIELLGKKIMKCGTRYFIQKDETNIYVEDLTKGNKEVDHFLIKFISNLHIKKNTASGPKPYSRTASGIKQLLIVLIPCIPNTPNFVKDLWQSNIGKLCFLNGYYEFKTKKFKQYDNETFTIAHVDKIYNPHVSQATIDTVMNKILNPILYDEKQRNHILHWFARGLAGEYTEKTWGAGLGNRNSGKSVITDYFRESFGSSYIGSFTSEELLCNRVGSGDVAKKNAFLIPFEFRRLNFSNELKLSDDAGHKLKLDGNMIKSISSGGDEKKARLNFKDEINFQIQGRMVLFMNELPSVSPVDAKETLNIFEFKSIFKRELSEQEQTITADEHSECKYFVADDNIKHMIKDEDIQNALIQIMFNSYTDKPSVKIVDDNNEDYNDEDVDDNKQLLKLFKFTSAHQDRISIKDYKEMLSDNGINMSASKNKLTLNKLGVGNAKSGSTRYYTGIKIQEPSE